MKKKSEGRSTLFFVYLDILYEMWSETLAFLNFALRAMLLDWNVGIFNVFLSFPFSTYIFFC